MLVLTIATIVVFVMLAAGFASVARPHVVRAKLILNSRLPDGFSISGRRVHNQLRMNARLVLFALLSRPVVYLYTAVVTAGLALFRLPDGLVFFTFSMSVLLGIAVSAALMRQWGVVGPPLLVVVWAFTHPVVPDNFGSSRWLAVVGPLLALEIFRAACARVVWFRLGPLSRSSVSAKSRVLSLVTDPLILPPFDNAEGVDAVLYTRVAQLSRVASPSFVKELGQAVVFARRDPRRVLLLTSAKLSSTVPSFDRSDEVDVDSLSSIQADVWLAQLVGQAWSEYTSLQYSALDASSVRDYISEVVAPLLSSVGWSPVLVESGGVSQVFSKTASGLVSRVLLRADWESVDGFVQVSCSVMMYPPKCEVGCDFIMVNPSVGAVLLEGPEFLDPFVLLEFVESAYNVSSSGFHAPDCVLVDPEPLSA